jgi:hypothetical protein
MAETLTNFHTQLKPVRAVFTARTRFNILPAPAPTTILLQNDKRASDFDEFP